MHCLQTQDIIMTIKYTGHAVQSADTLQVISTDGFASPHATIS